MKRFVKYCLYAISLVYLAGCETRTDEVDISTVSSKFSIEVEDFESPDAEGGTSSSRFFTVSGNLFSHNTETGNELSLTLTQGERLTISDDANEYELRQSGISPGAAGEHYVFYGHDSPEFSMNAPYYLLRYYRHDGAILENRLDTSEMAAFITPAAGTVWNPGLETLAVEWNAPEAPVEKLVLSVDCVSIPYSEEYGDYALGYDVVNQLRLDLDLTGESATTGCASDFTNIQLIQKVIEGSVDPGFEGGGEFILHRAVQRYIAEQT